MKILVQDKQGVRALEPGFADEKELQTFLRENSDLMPTDEIELGTPPLLCIGWEVGVASGSHLRRCNEYANGRYRTHDDVRDERL